MSENLSPENNGSPEALQKPPTVDPRKYYGSQDWVRQVLDRIGQTTPDSVELIGLPQMGKTTLLRFVASPKGALAEERFRAMLSPPFDRDPHRIFFLLVEFKLLPPGKHPFVYLYERFREDYSKYRQRTLEQFQQQDWELPVFEAEGEIDPSTALRKLARYFQMLEGIRPVFLFDDFDYAFRDIELEEANQLRHWTSWASFILTNTVPLSNANPTSGVSPFYTLMYSIPLNGLTRNEAETLVGDMALSTGRPMHPDDVRFILEQAGGHPGLIIRTVKAFWSERRRICLLETDEPLSKEYRTHLTLLLRPEFYRFFNLYWTYLDVNEKEVLRKIIRRQKLSDGDRRFAGTLVNRGLVVHDGRENVHKPFSSLFTDYLSETLAPSSEPAKLDLTGIEASLHQHLRHNPNQVCTFEQLLQEVWSHASSTPGEKEQQRRRMQVAISRLRSKLKEAGTGEDIINIRDVGYRYVPREV